MPDLSVDLLLVLVAAFAAGLIDAMVGGGGLIQIPALFAVYPSVPPAARSSRPWLRRMSSGHWCRSCCSPSSSMCCGARTLAASMRRAHSAIGLYDGFFGSGTGSLLIFVFVRSYGYDFLHAGAVIGARLALRGGSSFVHGIHRHRQPADPANGVDCDPRLE